MTTIITEPKVWAYTSVVGGVKKNLQLTVRQTPSWVNRPPKSKYAVEVICASLNPVDYKLPESPIESRVARITMPATPGMDFCGTLVAEPHRVVIGRLSWPVQHGTLGRHVLVSDNDFVDLPKTLTPEQGAAIPIAALTAYQSIVPYVRKDDRVIIFGGSGGVGTFSIQIAKLCGAYVVAVCSSRNTELCKELGSDAVVDYTREDVVGALARMKPFDLAVDNVGNDPSLHRRSRNFLKPDARFVLVSGMLNSIQGLISMAESLLRPTWLGGPPNPYNIVLCKSNKVQLEQITDWVASGSLKVVIDGVYPYDRAPEAFAKLRTGRARGKIVVKR